MIELLIAMCDGKRYCLFDHALAAKMRQTGLIWKVPGTGDYIITDTGRLAARTATVCTSPE
jgi:hypothetical protein